MILFGLLQIITKVSIKQLGSFVVSLMNWEGWDYYLLKSKVWPSTLIKLFILSRVMKPRKFQCDITSPLVIQLGDQLGRGLANSYPSCYERDCSNSRNLRDKNNLTRLGSYEGLDSLEQFQSSYSYFHEPAKPLLVSYFLVSKLSSCKDSLDPCSNIFQKEDQNTLGYILQNYQEFLHIELN